MNGHSYDLDSVQQGTCGSGGEGETCTCRNTTMFGHGIFAHGSQRVELRRSPVRESRCIQYIHRVIEPHCVELTSPTLSGPIALVWDGGPVAETLGRWHHGWPSVSERESIRESQGSRVDKNLLLMTLYDNYPHRN